MTACTTKSFIDVLNEASLSLWRLIGRCEGRPHSSFIRLVG
jgi:hypothetical protein